MKAKNANMPTTPKSGNAKGGTVLDCVAGCCRTTVSFASYLRATGIAVVQGLAGAGTGTGSGTGTTGAQGLPGVGAGVGAGVGGGTYGVVVTVVGM